MAGSRILVINNRDSFVFNIVRYLEELDAETDVVDSHSTGLDQISAKEPDGLIISPGPCTPAQAGVSVPAIQKFTGVFPILGVCLGHLAIAQAFGWTIGASSTPRHGRASRIDHNGEGLFKELPAPLEVGLYHSLIATPADGSPLRVDATSPSGEAMAISHREHPVFGVQFHPESILTACGHQLLSNFLCVVQTRVDA